MAFLKINNVSLKGVSCCVPANKVKTSDYHLFKEDNGEKFTKTTGIIERRVAPEGMCTSDLCCKAAEEVLAKLGWKKDTIDALVFTSVTPDYRSPATSCLLQHRLGLPTTCFTFDISAVCCGFIQGLTVLGSIMSNGNIKRALLLAGDTNSKTSSPDDQSRYPLLGDAGTATAWEYDPEADEILVNLMSDGANEAFVVTPDSGFRHFVTPESFIPRVCDDGIKRAPIHGIMNGMEVFSYAISECPKAIKALGEHFNIDLVNDVDYYLFHQANLKINLTIAKKLKLDVEKMPSNIQYFGNISCAAIPMLMLTNIREAISSKKLRLLFSAIGAGFVWGGAYMKTNNVVVTDLLEL
jgi:3-oxoacyl-[acyl-carrier-protein] synthase-3